MPIFLKKVIFSDEAHFHLNGIVDTQNCRIWGSEYPHAIHEKQMHPERATIYCSIDFQNKLSQKILMSTGPAISFFGVL